MNTIPCIWRQENRLLRLVFGQCRKLLSPQRHLPTLIPPPSTLSAFEQVEHRLQSILFPLLLEKNKREKKIITNFFDLHHVPSSAVSVFARLCPCCSSVRPSVTLLSNICTSDTRRKNCVYQSSSHKTLSQPGIMQRAETCSIK